MSHWLPPPPHGRRTYTLTAPRQMRGVALLIALVLLVVITIGSIVAVRSAIFSDMVSKNLRAQSLAMQAAEIALRYCETRITDSAAALNIFALNDAGITNEWQTAANWAAAGSRVNTVPTAFLGDTVAYNTPPQCIIRRLSYNEAYGDAELPPDAAKPEDRGMSPDYVFFFRITARGYSPDFERDSSDNPIAGAEAWVQSMVRGVI